MSDAPPLLPASTILLVRDAQTLEVLMVERHHQIDFVAGALVFPGGKAAADDADPRWAALCDGEVSDAERGFRIAAVREAFEESGMLLARPAAARGEGQPMAPPDTFRALLDLRHAIGVGATSFLDAIAQAGLVLALDALVFYAHWITPRHLPKRFDTRFYIAHTPAAQEAFCDGFETVDACWISPGDALAAAREGKRAIIFPTRRNIEMLAESTTADEAIAAARARKVVMVEPRIVRGAQGPMLTIPADAGYSVFSEPLDDNTR